MTSGMFELLFLVSATDVMLCLHEAGSCGRGWIEGAVGV